MWILYIFLFLLGGALLGGLVGLVAFLVTRLLKRH